MNKRSYFFILCVVLLFSCTRTKKDYFITGELMEKYEVKWPSKGIVRHGKAEVYNPDGTLVFEGSYWNNKLDRICKSYYDNGKLEYSVKYDKGKLLEVYEYYDINGNKLDYGYIKNGNGHLKKYNKTGKLREEGDVINGLREGEWKSYSNAGYFNSHYYHNGIMEGETFQQDTF